MKRLIPILAAVLITTTAHAFGIRCERATRPSEMIVCSTPSLMERDATLARNYRWLHDNLRPWQQERLEATETAWVRSQQACMFDADCIAEGYDSQIDKVLRALNAVTPEER